MSEAMKKYSKEHKLSISELCEGFGMKRDAYYKHQRRNRHAIATKTTVLTLVQERRKELPREGCKKMHKAFIEEFMEREIKLGRDKLFDLLREMDMLVKRKRSFVKTTNSYHRFHTYNNLIKNLEINRPNQVWVSDITYIRLTKGHCYLALITDAYSRKIVGYDISDSLELAGCLRALKMALWQARPEPGLIHHSDRGLQYCSNQYVEQLRKHNIQISMTEENHCYENAMAERVNGILKDEFYLDQNFSNVELAKETCDSAIRIYNTKRLHLSLGYKTPDEVFKMRA
jgi:putative transposase